MDTRVIKMNGFQVKCSSAESGLLMLSIELDALNSHHQKIMDRIGANSATRDLVNRAGKYENEKFIALMCSPELMGLKNA